MTTGEQLLNEIRRERRQRTADTCPMCGRPMGDDWTRHEPRVFAAGDALPAGATYERRESRRVADRTGDVTVPFFQALITAVVGAVLGAAVGAWRGGVLGGFVGFLVGGVVVFCAVWLLLLIDHRRALWIAERLTGSDIDGDGHIGKPEPRGLRVEVVEKTNNNTRVLWWDAPVSDAKMMDVARAILVTRHTFGRPSLVDDAGVLSQSEYRELAASMVDAGLLVDLPGNRRELTAAGRAMLARLLE